DARPRDIPQTNVARAIGGSARVASLFQRLSPRRDDFLSFDKLIRGVPKLAHSSAPDLRLFGDRKFPHQAVRSSPNNSPTVIELDFHLTNPLKRWNCCCEMALLPFYCGQAEVRRRKSRLNIRCSTKGG